MNNNFDAKENAIEIVKWTKEWFDKNCPNGVAVIGISGGKDSTVCAGILAKAIGPERVVGVLMPNGKQKDIADSYKVCDFLGIKPFVINISNAVDGIYEELEKEGFILKDLCTINTPPRIRLTTLYAVAGCVGGIVVNTSNASETYVGYFTKNADNRGDLSLLSDLTKTEVVAIGHALGLPTELVDKVPSDGLCGKTDEDNLGFTYEELDNFLRGADLSDEIFAKIDKAHISTSHKRKDMDSFKRV